MIRATCYVAYRAKENVVRHVDRAPFIAKNFHVDNFGIPGVEASDMCSLCTLHSKMMLASQDKKTDFLKTTFEDFLWIKTIYA